MSSCSCRLIAAPILEQRCEPIITISKHEPYEWALPGTLENLARVNDFLKEKRKSGYLFGGCLKKRLPRKDIDVFIEYDLEGPNCGYKTLGVDWWIRTYGAGYDVGENVNGIKVELGRSDREYHFKNGGGLLLPKDYLQEHPRSKLVRLLYSREDLQNLKGDKTNGKQTT